MDKALASWARDSGCESHLEILWLVNNFTNWILEPTVIKKKKIIQLTDKKKIIRLIIGIIAIAVLSQTVTLYLKGVRMTDMTQS